MEELTTDLYVYLVIEHSESRKVRWKRIDSNGGRKRMSDSKLARSTRTAQWRDERGSKRGIRLNPAASPTDRVLGLFWTTSVWLIVFWQRVLREDPMTT